MLSSKHDWRPIKALALYVDGLETIRKKVKALYIREAKDYYMVSKSTMDELSEVVNRFDKKYDKTKETDL